MEGTVAKNDSACMQGIPRLNQWEKHTASMKFKIQFTKLYTGDCWDLLGNHATKIHGSTLL